MTSELQDTARYLEEERARADELHETVQRLESQARNASDHIARLTTSEKSLTDKTRDQVCGTSTASLCIC